MAATTGTLCSNVLDLIGNTPMVRLRRFDAGPCELFVRLESQNPGGSIKDRIGRSMIEAAEAEGKLRPGSVLVEATAGNTGLGLALVASQKGYRLTLVIPDKMSQEKVLHLRAMGATIVMTRSDVGKGHPQYYQDMAERIARETPGAFYVNQFGNPANPLAHETTTGPEIWAQAGGHLDAVVCGVGSGGTITGLSRYFARVAPHVEMVLADPVGSVLAEYTRSGRIGSAGAWLVEGIGEDFLPPIADLTRVRHAYSIGDAESMETARLLLKQEGLLAGSSSGTLVAAALRYCREQTRPKRVVTFVCDTGSKYLSKVYNDYWMADQGLVSREPFGDLRDLITRRFAEGGVVSVAPGDPLAVAYGRMRLHDVSQLPVLDGEAVVGIVDESDLLLGAYQGRGEAAGGFDRPVRDVMTRNVQTVGRTARIDDLLPIFDAGRVAVVSDDAGFHGLVTRVDMLNFLRKATGSGKDKPEDDSFCNRSGAARHDRYDPADGGHHGPPHRPAFGRRAPGRCAGRAGFIPPPPLRHADDPRRPVAGPDDRGGDDADLHDQHIRAAVAGGTQGVRLRAVA